MPIKLESECGPKCRSHQHALHINSAITKCGLKEFKAYCCMCHNAAKISDQFGRNVLHMAASCGRLEIIEYLLEEKQYNLKSKDYESGWTALHRALFYGQLAAARLLIQYKHDVRSRDHEGLSPLDIIIKDRPEYISYSPREPNEVYTWGDNTNYNLGHSSQDRRIIPERVGVFKRISGFVIQVVLCKFHTVFLTQIGQVYTCGHGHGGRLGHTDQQTYVVPKLVENIKRENCIQVAAARDHTLFLTEKGTVYGCGSNESHQLGFFDPILDQSLSPRLINPEIFKGYYIRGICAGRYHSVIYSMDAVFTFGLNAGQLGHKRGDKFQIQPRMISSLNDPDIRITSVQSSDSAIVCLTSLGNVYICSRYTCRKIGSRWLDISKICVAGGTLDHQVTTDLDLLKEKGGSELIVTMLNTKGKVFLWREKKPRFTRCSWVIKRELTINDIYVNRCNMALVTDKGEGFIGSWSPVIKDKKKAQPTTQKSREVNDEFPQVRLLDLLLKDGVEDIQVERIHNIHRATNIFSDSKAKNFAVLQVLPNGCLTEIPYVRDSTISKDFSTLLKESDEGDVIHDVIIKTCNRTWAAHKYILANRSQKFYKLIMATDISTESNDVTVLDLNPIHPVIVQELLNFLYTDTCKPLTIGAQFVIEEPNTEENVVDPKIEYMTKTQRKKYYKRLNKENSEKEEEVEEKTVLCVLKEVAEEYGINSLVERLENVKSVDGVICSNGKSLGKSKLVFDRIDLSELSDVCIQADDNTTIKCHKCVLVARMEYFYSMLATGWIETSDSTGLSLPVSGQLLQILIHYVYTDEAPQITDCVNVELLCNVLVLADKLLIERLKELSEVAIVNSLNFWNVADLLKFSLIYNAHQLYVSCQQFISLNLPVFLESRLLDSLHDDEIEKLTMYYRQLIPSMNNRIITPYTDGPSIEYLHYLAHNFSEDLNEVLCDVTPRKGRVRKNSENEPRVRKNSENEPRLRKNSENEPKGQIKKERQISICSDISIYSEDDEIPDDKNNSNILTIEEDISILDSVQFVDNITSSSHFKDGVKLEGDLSKQNKKNPLPKKTFWKEAKKHQKQKEVEDHQQKVLEKKQKEKAKEKAKEKVVCPWASAKNETKFIRSFRDLMIEEKSDKSIKIPSPRNRPSISSPEPDDNIVDTVFTGTSPEHLNLASWVSLPTKVKSKKAPSSPEVKEIVNPWQKVPTVVATSPILTNDHSFTQILRDEKHKKLTLQKEKKKPFKLVQIEDRAIQELMIYYKVNDITNEYITIERVPKETASPLWKIEKPKSTSSIW